MPGWELIVGCVGKPSAGKSTLFNAVTEGNAKVRTTNPLLMIRLETILSQQLNQIRELPTI